MKTMRKLMLWALLLTLVLTLAACNLPFGIGDGGGDEGAELVIGTKNTTEQNILAQIAASLIEDRTEHTVTIDANGEYDSATLLEQAADDDVSLYFDYVGSIYTNGMGHTLEEARIATLSMVVEDALWVDHELTTAVKVGYDGGISAFMTPDRQEDLGDPTSLGLVSAIAGGLVIGMEESFYTRQDGYTALCQAYDLEFKEARAFSEAAGFEALARGDIDIMIGDSTTMYNNLYELVRLTDDQSFFLPQDAICILSPKVNTNYPEVAAALGGMKELLTAGAMSGLIEKVDQARQPLKEVADDFLRARSLL